MSLPFGNLTQDFVNFSSAVNGLDPNDPNSTARLDQAAKDFRHIAAKDSAILTYIGSFLLPCYPKISITNLYCPRPFRYWPVRLHIHLHALLGLHR